MAISSVTWLQKRRTGDLSSPADPSKPELHRNSAVASPVILFPSGKRSHNYGNYGLNQHFE